MNATGNKPPTPTNREIQWLKYCILLSAMLFVIGISLPMMTITKLILFRNSFSIISGTFELLNEGHIFLFIVITVFSIILPVLKIGILYQIISNLDCITPKIQRYLHFMHEYGRWAMLDVMVVAVLIVTVKLGAIASIQVHSGLYVFGASVVLIMFSTHRVVRITNAS